MDEQYIAHNRLEGQIAFILMKAGVTGPEIDQCLEWAFGPGALYSPPCDWPDKWNKLHPQHRAKKNEKFVDFVFTVGFLFTQWKQWKKKKEKEN